MIWQIFLEMNDKRVKGNYRFTEIWVILVYLSIEYLLEWILMLYHVYTGKVRYINYSTTAIIGLTSPRIIQFILYRFQGSDSHMVI